MKKTSGIGVIICNQKILLCKRKHDKSVFPNCWDLPGGRSNESETPKQTAIREVKEECNIDFIPTLLFETKIFGKRKLHIYLGERSGKIIIQEKEVTGYGWFSYKEAIALPLAFEYEKTITELKSQNYI